MTLSSLGLYPIDSSSNLRESEAEPSFIDRLAAIVAPIFQAIERLIQRLTDPNWRAFAEKSEGHFDPRSDSDAWNLASKNALKILTNSTSPEKIKDFFDNEKEANNAIEHLYNLPGINGSCFGNCAAMAYSISESGRFWTVLELKELERSETFVKTAQTVQVLSELCAFFNQNQPFEFHKIEMEDISKTFEILSVQKLGKPYAIKRISDFSKGMKTTEELKDPNFCGGVLISGIERRSSKGHRLLLEIDKINNNYILYDNNSGFYEWDNLNDCLEQTQLRLISHYHFTICKVQFFHI